MPIKATSVCQSWSQNTRSVQLKNTGCTRYKPNALFTPADGTPALKTHLSFSGNIFRVLNCFDLVVPFFLWSLDYFYLWTPSMGTAAWKRQPCITFTLLRDKAKKKMKVAHPRGVLLAVISPAHGCSVHLFQADGPGSLRICMLWLSKANRQFGVGHSMSKRSLCVCQLKTFWFSFPRIQSWMRRNQPSLPFYSCTGSVSKLHKFPMLSAYGSIKQGWPLLGKYMKRFDRWLEISMM